MTLKDLFNKASSFVQQNPTPMGFLNQQFQQRVAQPVVQNVQRAIPPIQQSFTQFRQQAPQQMNTMLQGGINRLYSPPPATIKPFTPLTEIGRGLAKGQLSDMATRLTVGTPEQRSAYNFNLLTSKNPEERNQWLRGAKSEAEGAAMAITAPISKFDVNRTVQLLRHKINKADVDLIGKFARLVEKGQDKGNLGQLGNDISILAKNVFGKQAENWTNRQIKNSFDLVLGKIGTVSNTAGLGLNAVPVRKIIEAEKKVNPLRGTATQTAGKMGQKSSAPAVPATTEPILQPPVSSVQKSGGGTLPNGLQSAASPSSIPPGVKPPVDAVQKIIQVLKGAKPIRGQQEAIYSKIRSQQAGALGGIGQGMKGEAGYYQKLGKLKGEMPKVSFESIKKEFTQPELDDLFNKVEQSSLGVFEKVGAQTGLKKLLGAEGGTIPTEGELKLLSEVFPPEFIQSVLDNRSTIQKLFALGTEALNLPRAVMATADMSAPLRQGIFLVGRPKQWLPAFGNMFKYFASKKAYQGLNEQIKARPTYRLMREAKLALTDMSPILQSREEQFMSSLVEKIPGFGKIAGASNRAYSGFLNKLRADVFDDLVKNASQQGIKVEGKVLNDIASFVNAATGRGNLGSLQRAAPLLNAAFFSPRLMASRVNLLNPVYYAKLDPLVRKEALKSLLTFGGTAMSVLTLAKLGGAEVGADPRSADFGKIKVGNTRYDILGGFQQYIKLAAQLITGKLISTTTGKEYTLGEGYKPLTRLEIVGNFLQSKESPIVGFATGLLQGTNSIGQKFDVPTELMSRFIPMIVQDMYDLAKEKGSVAEGIIAGLPGAFGVGSQTYGKQIPTMETSKAGNTTIKLNPVGGMAEDIMARIRGTQPSNIPQNQWAGIAESEQKKKMDAVLKDKIKQQAEEGNMEASGSFVPVLIDGKTKVIDTSFQPTPPELTGLTELDKKAVSKFNSEITSKANDIYDLYKAGVITQDEANTQLIKLKTLKAGTTAPKKPKKITAKKIAAPKKMKLVMPKKTKIQNIKIAKPPSLKTGKKRTAKIKAIKVKPIKFVNLKGLDSSKKLV